MSEWIKELEKFAEDLNPAWGNPDLHFSSDAEPICFLWYEDGDDTIKLDGNFTIDQLQDLATHMEKYKAE